MERHLHPPTHPSRYLNPKAIALEVGEAALDRMSYAELKAIAPIVAMKITEREKAEREAVKAELKELAQSKGFDMADLFGDGGKPVKEKKTVSPKYRNPADTTQTWTGRGRMDR